MDGLASKLRAAVTQFIPRRLARVTQFLSRRLARVISGAFDKGRAGNGYWLALGVTLWGVRKLTRMGSRVDEVVYSEKLVPGQSVTIRHLHEDFLSVE